MAVSENIKLYHASSSVNAGDIDNEKAVFAFANGTISIVRLKDFHNQIIEVSSGAILALSIQGKNIYLSDETGKIKFISENFEQEVKKEIKGKWVEVMESSERHGLTAFAVGKEIHLLGKKNFVKTKHESSITALCFSPKGARLAASHYNGVTLWPLEEKSEPEKLIHKGSHISVTWSPDGTYVVTGTQEKMLKIWNLKNNDSLFMSGYMSKVRSFAWLKNGSLLATSGAEQIVIWPFSGGGPNGKNPTLIGPGGADAISYLASHPKKDVVAAAYENGLIIIADISSKEWFPVRAITDQKITLLKWSGDGKYIIFGDEIGNYGVLVAGT